MAEDLLTYLGLVKGHWAFSLPGALTLVLGFAGALGAKLGLSPSAWLLLTLLCAVCSGFLVWRGARHRPVRADHERALEVLAARLLADPVGSPIGAFDRDMFEAHFPDLAARREEVLRKRKRELVAQHELCRAIAQDANARFSWDDGWDPRALDAQARILLITQGGLQGEANAPIFDRGLQGTKMTWNGVVIHREASDSERVKADVESWIDRLRSLPEADDLRGAIGDHRAIAAEVGRGLNAIRQHAAVARADDCPVCRGVQ